MDIDRQAIERRDFPIIRRGYDPVAVDAHLRGLAQEIEQLARAQAAGAEPSLAATASTQVQSILQAAETAAADIEREALQRAAEARENADRDAQRTREEAIKQARAHVAAVAQATSVLLERVGSVDGEVSALLESLRGSASRLAGDLAAVDANMAELYDAAAGNAGAQPTRAVADELPRPSVPLPPPPSTPPAPRAAAAASHPQLSPSEETQADVHVDPDAPPPPPPPPAAAPARPTAENGDLDGARLVALNMALNGSSRGDTERYLAEHFQLSERQRLVDEVYAAIEA